MPRRVFGGAAPVALVHHNEVEERRREVPEGVDPNRDPGAGRWSAVFPEIPGCASAGDTEQEAVANAKEALALWFEPRDLELEEGARILEVAIP